LGILEETFRILKEEIGEDKPVLVKISPFTEPVLLGEVADLLAKTKAIKGVSTQNTVPNTLILDENGKSVITSEDGFGGGAGPAVFHSALGQVARLRQNFTKNNRPDMIICGAGGVATYVDAQRMLDKGADIVMVNTMVQERGLKFFGEVLSEYVEAESV
jgi:dihydroorotate dehydrogenase